MRYLVTIILTVVFISMSFQSMLASEANQPSNISVAVDSLTRNLITWEDETAVTGETYNIYVSEHQISAIHSTGVVKVGRNIPEGAQQFLHTLYTPAANGSINYFYAVTAVDPSGAENEVVAAGSNSMESSIENEALAVGYIPLIDEEVIIDGDIEEYMIAPPFIMDTTSWVEGFWDGMSDLNAKVYLLMDTENLYLAVSVIDNAMVQDFTGFGTWNGDSFEMNLGLYSLPAKNSHKRFSRGSEPDYQYRLSINEEAWLHVPYPGRSNSSLPNHAVEYVEMVVIPTLDGYIMEAKIPFAEIANDPKMSSHPGGTDSLFVPEEGMVIPIDFTLNDADVDVYEGHIYYFWEGDSIPRPFESPLVWSQTIIGKSETSTDIEIQNQNTQPEEFALLQNYPNPFNPETTIKYSIEKPQHIALKIYNINGELIRTLIDESVSAGSHVVKWNGANEFGEKVSSGIYFSKITGENHSSTLKMMMLK